MSSDFGEPPQPGSEESPPPDHRWTDGPAPQGQPAMDDRSQPHYAPYGQPHHGFPPSAYPPGYASPAAYPFAMAPSPPYAGWGQRLAAYLPDQLIIAAIWIALILAFALLSLLAAQLGAVVQDALTLLVVIGYLGALVVSICYFPFFWVRDNGRTPGNKVMRIRVVRTNQQPFTVGPAIVRLIGYYLNGFIFGIGWFWPLWDDQKRTWADMIADTIVLNAT